MFDIFFTRGKEVIDRADIRLSKANLEELCLEMGFDGSLRRISSKHLAEELDKLLATNCSHEGDWLITTARVLRSNIDRACKAGAYHVEFKPGKLGGPTPPENVETP